MKSYRLFPFWITFEHNYKNYRAIVEQTYLDERFEVFRVKGGARDLEIKSNRPLLRNKGLKNKRINMVAMHANIRYQSVVDKIIECLNQHILTIEK